MESNQLPSREEAKAILQTRPMSFQKNAANRLKEILSHDSRAFLADEPGLGKTFSSTKLMCDMAADYLKENSDEPYYVLYIAPNGELLRQNSDEILRKAKSYISENRYDFEVHSVMELVSEPNRVKKTIEQAISYRVEVAKEEYRAKINKVSNGHVHISNKMLSDEILPKVLEILKKDKFPNLGVGEICNYYVCNPQNKAQNLHKAMGASGVGDGSKSKDNRAKYEDSLVEAFNAFCIEEYKAKIDELDSEKEQRINDAINQIDNFYKSETLTKWYKKRLVETLQRSLGELLPSWDEYKKCECEYNTPDRLSYADEILSPMKNNIHGLILLTASQGVLFDSGRDIPTRESTIIQNNNAKSRFDYTKNFLSRYKVHLVMWDEFHRYSTKLSDNNAFFEAEGNGEFDLKNLFVSATPYRTNISDKDLIGKLYSDAELDDEEEMSSLPSFKEDFAPLFCYKHMELREEDLIRQYDAFFDAISDDQAKENFEKSLKTRMVRHERTRLQGKLEEHIRKYPIEKNCGDEYSEILANTIRQSRLLETANYQIGGRKWSFLMPWILSFSTSRGKATKNEKGKIVSTYFKLLQPTGNTANKLSNELFVYADSGDVKPKIIHTLPKQNLAFHQICDSNVKDDMRQLLWVPATMPLYSVGEESIFTRYKDYSKLLVFSEYRYLQRGGSRLLSDYVVCENRANVDAVPENFPPEIPVPDAASMNKYLSFKIFNDDFRKISLNDLLERIPFDDITDKLATIASPAVCAERLGMNAEEIAEAFHAYICSEGKKEALWNWIWKNKNGYREEERWLEGIYRYCAEGNLLAVLEEWMFMLKGDDTQEKTDMISEVFRYTGTIVHVQTHATTLEKLDGHAGKCSFAEQLCADIADNGGYANDREQARISAAFSSPLWPFILFAGRGAQEGVDMHEYALRIMHLTLPRGAVSYEQRNGRIDRFRSLLVRRRVVEALGQCAVRKEEDCTKDLLARSFAKALQEKEEMGMGSDALFPNWHFATDKNTSRHHFEEILPIWPHTEESCAMEAYDAMLDSYRGSMGIVGDAARAINLSADPS